MFKCQWRLKCDACGALSFFNDDSTVAEKAAIKKGWVSGGLHYGGTVHLCPDCAAKERPDWWPSCNVCGYPDGHTEKCDKCAGVIL